MGCWPTTICVDLLRAVLVHLGWEYKGKPNCKMRRDRGGLVMSERLDPAIPETQDLFTWVNTFPSCVYASFDWFSVNCFWIILIYTNNFVLFSLMNRNYCIFLLYWQENGDPVHLKSGASCFIRFKACWLSFVLALPPALAWVWTYFFLFHERLLNTIFTTGAKTLLIWNKERKALPKNCSKCMKFTVHGKRNT